MNQPPPPPPAPQGAEEAPEPAAMPNGVLITVTADEGDQELTIQTLGDVKQTELPGLLGVARKMAEARLGIGGG